jgi:FHS family L-fucose permease-like MFS transporter
MVVGFAIAAFGAILFFPASVFHQYALFLAALFIVAIGIVMLQVAANPYVTVLGPAKTASSRLALVQGVGSVGTTVAPVIGAYFILSKLSESQASSAAVRVIIIALVVFRLKLPVIKSQGSTLKSGSSHAKSVFAFRNLNLGVIAIFLYVGAEVSIGTFLTNYISDALHIEIKDANNYVAFYWASMVVGRLIGAVVLKAAKPSLVLSICATLAAGLVVLSVSTHGQLAVWSMIMIGLFNSIMFAVIFSLSVNGLGNFTTKASGILSTAIAGGAVISFSQGLLKDHFTWPVAFMLPLLCYLYILFYGLSGYKSKYANQ